MGRVYPIIDGIFGRNFWVWSIQIVRLDKSIFKMYLVQYLFLIVTSVASIDETFETDGDTFRENEMKKEWKS